MKKRSDEEIRRNLAETRKISEQMGLDTQLAHTNFTCAHCSSSMSMSEGFGTKVPKAPKVGSVMLCATCDTLQVVDEGEKDNYLRLMTQEEHSRKSDAFKEGLERLVGCYHIRG
jgi:RNase P subunit RPR2